MSAFGDRPIMAASIIACKAARTDSFAGRTDFVPELWRSTPGCEQCERDHHSRPQIPPRFRACSKNAHTFVPVLIACARLPGGRPRRRAATARRRGSASPTPSRSGSRALQRPVDRFQHDDPRHGRAPDPRRTPRQLRRSAASSSPACPAASRRRRSTSIGACESGGDPTAVSSDGTYRGKYQFDYGTWESVGGTGDPAAAPEAEQDYRAALLYAQLGLQPLADLRLSLGQRRAVPDPCPTITA